MKTQLQWGYSQQIGDIACSRIKFVDPWLKMGWYLKTIEKDRRVCYLALTPQGEAVYNNNTAIRYDIFKTFYPVSTKMTGDIYRTY